MFSLSHCFYDIRINGYVISSFCYSYKDRINPYHAEFLKWNNPPTINGTFHCHF